MRIVLTLLDSCLLKEKISLDLKSHGGDSVSHDFPVSVSQILRFLRGLSAAARSSGVLWAALWSPK